MALQENNLLVKPEAYTDVSLKYNNLEEQDLFRMISNQKSFVEVKSLFMWKWQMTQTYSNPDPLRWEGYEWTDLSNWSIWDTFTLNLLCSPNLVWYSALPSLWNLRSVLFDQQNPLSIKLSNKQVSNTAHYFVLKGTVQLSFGKNKQTWFCVFSES